MSSIEDLDGWAGCPAPDPLVLDGRFVRLERWQAEAHASGLFGAICGPADDELWRYIPAEKPQSINELTTFFDGANRRSSGQWRTLVIIDKQSDSVLGTASYMRIREAHGSVEVGCVIYSKQLQRKPEATEAMYLMAHHVFDELGYRRYEWKCHNDNEASRHAAARLGFTFEGVFRKDLVIRGENRDTAWFSMTNDEWPGNKTGFETWLSAENFDPSGSQIRSLAALRLAV